MQPNTKTREAMEDVRLITNEYLERLACECGAVRDLRCGEWRFNAHRLREFAKAVRVTSPMENAP